MPDRLQEIRARLDAATPGPWENEFGVVADANGNRHYIPNEYGDWDNPADPDFIAHAPADIAWLLDEVERLRNTKVSVAQPLCDGGEDA